ncbi:D-glycero-beta-D-manno-heptose-7-phosphate kinase [bacterium]|nr:D-glycero-beta-D-manno-heptose-7-phosphate kinase [bacterium]
MMMNQTAVQQIISRFPSLRILVLGDFMLDHFVMGRVDRISPEAPVPIVDVDTEQFHLGGAGNVVMNGKTLGAQMVPLGVIGNDWAAERIHELFLEEQLPSDGLLTSERPTTLKTRILAHQQQVVRVDREQRTPISDELQNQLANQFLEMIDSVDGVIISDYAKGTLTPALLAKILPEARKKNKLVCLDPKTRHFSSYTPVTVITPNQTEASSLLGYPIVSEEDLMEAAQRILKLIDCTALLITRGEKGMALFANGELRIVPTKAREVYDVTGAGDTVVTAVCLALAAGAEMIEAVELANAAAGVVVGKVGTAAVTVSELLACF